MGNGSHRHTSTICMNMSDLSITRAEADIRQAAERVSRAEGGAQSYWVSSLWVLSHSFMWEVSLSSRDALSLGRALLCPQGHVFWSSGKTGSRAWNRWSSNQHRLPHSGFNIHTCPLSGTSGREIVQQTVSRSIVEQTATSYSCVLLTTKKYKIVAFVFKLSVSGTLLPNLQA